MDVNLKVCRAMVGSMFDDLLDRQSDTDKVRVTLNVARLNLI